MNYLTNQITNVSFFKVSKYGHTRVVKSQSEMTYFYPWLHTPRTVHNITSVHLYHLQCIWNRYRLMILFLKDRIWVPNIEQNYNLIPSEYLQIFFGIYVMSPTVTMTKSHVKDSSRLRTLFSITWSESNRIIDSSCDRGIFSQENDS